MGKKRLALNMALNIVSYATTVIIAFFLTPYLVNTLGKEAYSFYPMANNFVSYMSIITVALNSMASRFITIEIVRGNVYKANKYFASVFFSNLILSLILLVLMTIVVIFLQLILNIPIYLVFKVKLLFSLIFASMLINITTSVFGVAVFAKNRIDLRSYAEFVGGILRVILFIILFYFFPPSIYFVGIVAVILSLVYLCFHFYFTKKLLPDMKISFQFFDIKFVKELLFSGIWNSVEQLGGTLMVGLTLLLANIYLGAAAGGEYSIAQTVPFFINGVISMLSAVFFPVITQKYAKGDKEGLINEVKNAQRVMGMITNIPIAVFIAVGVEFYSLWVPNENAYHLQIISILSIIHLVIVGVVWPIANLNTVMNRVKTPSLIMVFNGILNIIVVYLLMKFTGLGIYSIAITSMVILSVWFGVFIPIYPCSELGIKWSTFCPAIAKSIFSTIIIYVVSLTIKNFFIINSWYILLLVCGICGLIGLIINLFILFKPNEIQSLIKDIKTMILKQ